MTTETFSQRNKSYHSHIVMNRIVFVIGNKEDIYKISLNSVLRRSIFTVP